MESLPEGIRLRRMLNPAPLPRLNSRSSAWRRAASGRLRMELAWPNASETPNPSMVWYVVAPLTDTVEAALAGVWAIATSPPAMTTLATAELTSRPGRNNLGMGSSLYIAAAVGGLGQQAEPVRVSSPTRQGSRLWLCAGPGATPWYRQRRWQGLMVSFWSWPLRIASPLWWPRRRCSAPHR